MENKDFLLLIVMLLIASFVGTAIMWVDASEMYKKSYYLVTEHCSIGRNIPVYNVPEEVLQNDGKYRLGESENEPSSEE